MTFDRSLPLDATTSQAIVDDLTAAYEMIDAAMVQTLRASANMIETGRKVGLDPKSGQKLFADMAACTGAMMESRQSLVSAHHQAHRIRMKSTASHIRMVGCPWVMPEDETQPAKLAAVA